MSERVQCFDYHDWSAGHVTLLEDEEYFYLYVKHRDLQFSKKDGSCVGGGTTLGGPANLYCAKCHEEPPPPTEDGMLEVPPPPAPEDPKP